MRHVCTHVHLVDRAQRRSLPCALGNLIAGYVRRMMGRAAAEVGKAHLCCMHSMCMECVFCL
jgi:hypothetical protein